MEIPIVNLEGYTLGEVNIPPEKRQKLCSGLKTAFTEVGFVYLENTGITQQEVRTDFMYALFPVLSVGTALVSSMLLLNLCCKH